MTFSTTKAAAALAVALLYEQGRLRYDDPVSKYWPGFGTHGRDNVTIQMALSHMVSQYPNVLKRNVLNSVWYGVVRHSNH